MKFIMGESLGTLIDRFSYRGVIGLFYDTTLGGVLTYLIFGIVAILAVIGLAQVLKWILWGFPKKK